MKKYSFLVLTFTILFLFSNPVKAQFETFDVEEVETDSLKWRFAEVGDSFEFSSSIEDPTLEVITTAIMIESEIEVTTIVRCSNLSKSQYLWSGTNVFVLIKNNQLILICEDGSATFLPGMCLFSDDEDLQYSDYPESDE